MVTKMLFVIVAILNFEISFAASDEPQLFLPPGGVIKLRAVESFKSSEATGAEPLFVDGYNVDFENQISRSQNYQNQKDELARWNLSTQIMENVKK